MTGVALHGEVVPPAEPPPDEPDFEPASSWPAPDIITVPPDELELVTDPPELEPDPPDELEPAVVMGAPEELELDEFVPVTVGDPPEPDDAEAPEPAPLDPPGPRSVSPPLLELEPFVVAPPDSEELAPPEPGLLVVELPVASEELPHPAPEPARPQRITRVVRRYIAIHPGRRRCPPEGLKWAQKGSGWGLPGGAAPP